MLSLDHWAISADTLESGVAEVEAALGLSLDAGGQHAAFGTHNRLLGLGDLYLEVIAIDPAAPAPDRPRWFDLDNFSGSARGTNWIVRCPDMAAALSALPAGMGDVHELERGDLRWQMAVPPDGKLPFDGAMPAVISWQGTAHPTQRLPERGCRLHRLEIAHPNAEALRGALSGLFDDPRVVLVEGAQKAIRAEIDTPHGRRVLP